MGIDTKGKLHPFQYQIPVYGIISPFPFRFFYLQPYICEIALGQLFSRTSSEEKHVPLQVLSLISFYLGITISAHQAIAADCANQINVALR